MHDEDEYLVPLLEAGAAGYVVKSVAGAELLGAVRAIAAGRSWVRPQAAPLLAEAWSKRAKADETRQRHDSLSQRERDVFLLLAQGYTTSQIGRRLFISAKTVDTYRRRVNAQARHRRPRRLRALGAGPGAARLRIAQSRLQLNGGRASVSGASASGLPQRLIFPAPSQLRHRIGNGREERRLELRAGRYAMPRSTWRSAWTSVVRTLTRSDDG